ncbi:MAG: putative PEP-binding protein [Vulcanimicrobiaceae bacterium]
MRCKGVAVVPGIALGPLWSPGGAVAPAAGTLADFERARGRFSAAASSLPVDLRLVYEGLAADPMWEDGIQIRLSEGRPLSDAIRETGQVAAAQLAALDDPYLRARASDVEQTAAHLVRLLADTSEPPDGAIVVARDVSPIELQRWATGLAGIVLLDVSPTAHIAIVARGLGLPAVALVGAKAAELAVLEPSDDELAVLNGFEGWLETAADAELIYANPEQRIVAQPDPAPVELQGRRVGVLANLNSPDDAPLGQQLGADGVGLVRTEFLYVDRKLAPSLEEESTAYRRIAAAFTGKPLIVRTLDLGGDKLVERFRGDGVDHGMLGVRGIRLCLREPEFFAQHLRAVLIGFAGSDLRLMFPMISNTDEFIAARNVVRDVAKELHVPVPPLGIMLEIPAAAYALDGFAREGAAFVSLGTNDLEQYFFAESRLLAGASHEGARNIAWRRFLAETVAKAKLQKLEVGVCGEAAGDPALAELWLAWGVDELSVAPALVPWTKARLRTVFANVRETVS